MTQMKFSERDFHPNEKKLKDLKEICEEIFFNLKTSIKNKKDLYSLISNEKRTLKSDEIECFIKCVTLLKTLQYAVTAKEKNMLTIQQRKAIGNMDEYNSETRRVIRKRILDRMDCAIDDMVLIFNNFEKFPDLKNRIPPERMEKLMDCYFTAFKVDIGFSDPKKVIKILGENAALKRENALLTQELGTMVHRVEHFKYLASHVTSLLEKERQENDIIP